VTPDPDETTPDQDHEEEALSPEEQAEKILNELGAGERLKELDADRDYDDGESGDGKISQATRLVGLARRQFRTVLGTDGKCYAVPLEGAQVALTLRGENGLRTRLARTFFDETGSAAGSSAIADAMTVLEGQAVDTEPEPVELRVARHQGALVLDLGTPDGRAVVIDGDGWEIADASPVLFRRTRLTSPMPTPVRTAKDGPDPFDRLRDLLNVSEAGFRLMIAWMVAGLFPAIPHPILSLSGEQGTAKSTTGRMLVSLIDPSPAPLRAAPKDVKDWTVQAAASWTVMLDNVSTIPAWFSDTLCKGVTGEASVGRALYTDDDVNVLQIQRVIGMTTIDAGALKGDLAERLLMVELDPIPPHKRRTDEWVKTAFEAAAPVILGGLLDLTSKVLATLPTVNVAELPRLADFAKILAAIDEINGWATLMEFTNLAREITEAVIEADPFADAARALIHEKKNWTGTAARLLELLPAPDGGLKGWPRTPRGVSGHLRRVAPALRKHGIEIEFVRSSDGSGTRLIRLGIGDGAIQPSDRHEASWTQDDLG
jgi:hypothetical protein